MAGSKNEIRYKSRGVAAAQRGKSKFLMIFGAVFGFIWAFGAVGGIANYKDLREGLPLYILMLIPHVWMFWRGIVAGRLADAATQYESIFTTDRDGIVTMDELTKQRGKSPEAILKELDEIFKKGYFNNCTLQKGQNPCVIIRGAARDDERGIGFVEVKCESCGGTTRIRAGSSGKCDYCGSPINAFRL